MLEKYMWDGGYFVTEIRDRRHAAWFWLDKDVIDRYGPQIGAYGIAVYTLLARYADNKGQAHPSLTTMARQLGASKRTIIRLIDTLSEAGMIEKTSRSSEHGDYNSNIYTLLHIGGSDSREPPSDSREPPSDSGTLRVVTHGNQGGIPQSPPTSFLTRSTEQELKEQENTFVDQPGKPGKSTSERSSSFSRLKKKPAYSDLFWTFYAAYPRHEDPDDAWKAWQSLDGDAIAPTIMAGVDANKRSNAAWTRGDRKYIKLPAAFLRKGGYKSDFPAQPTAGEHDPVHFRQLLDAAGIPYEC